MDIRNTFLAGKLNLDSDLRIINQGEYLDALNIRIANSEGSDLGAIEKSLSNAALTSLNLGSNIYTLASLRDEFEEKIYWAVLSDSGCYIVEYDVSGNTPTFVLQDTRVGIANVLGFVPGKRLQMVLIVDSDNNNRLLGFTDNNTQPKLINIERAKTYGVNGFDEEMILLIKKPPLFAPTLVLGDTGNEENNIEEKFLVFFYRYIYLDGEYSALSPASDYPFRAKSFKYDFSAGTNESMVNAFNKATISFNTGRDIVTDVEIVYKESGSNNLYLIETFNKADKSWADNTIQSFEFSNNKIYRVLAERELFRLYDNVPLLAKALAVINNRLVFGNYTENYNIEDELNNKITVDFTLEHITTAITSGIPTKSMKSNRDYEIAIAYLDDYGRMTTPLTSLNNSVHIPTFDCINKNSLRVTMASKAPAFAGYYRFFIKQNKIDYDSISPVIFYQDGAYRWVKLENADKDKIKEGDELIVKSDSSQILNTLVKVKVLEITTQEQNFLQPEDVIDSIKEKPGVYFKIKPDGFRLNPDDFENFEFNTYHNARRRYHDALNSGTSDIFPASFYGDTLDDMTTSGTSTLGNMIDARYIVDIDALGTSATGTVTLTGGASGSVDGITVNGVQIMSGAEVFDTDLDTTSANVAANITNHTSTPNYTAVAVGSIITITSIEIGASINGYVVVSSTTTITTTDVNMSGATNDTFRWSDDNGATFTSGVAITGGAQALNNGAQVTFVSTTGHGLLDIWEFYMRGPIVSDNSRAYAWFRINGEIGETLTSSELTLEDEIIENGAVIDLNYDEWNRGDVNWTISSTSGAQYDNIIEWYYKENIGAQITTEFPGFDLTNITFQRCVVYNATNGNAQYSWQNADGFMTMVVRSQNSQSSTKWVYARGNTTLFQSSGSTRLLFETEPIDENQDIFFEIGRTYGIDANGNHLGFDVGDTAQDFGTNDAILNLPIYNCYSWGNAFESYKIKDLFNGKTMKMDTRPSTPIENYRENKRIASLTYSNVYEQSTNYNALNEFNLSLGNFKDLDDKYGSVQAIVSWNTDLDVWQEDKVHKIYYDKKVIYNRDGSSNLSATDDILQDVISYSGEYGISTHPESLAVWGNYTYWADAKRGVFLRKGQSGIEVISNFGIRDWTRDAMINLTTFILGCYDPYFGQYVVSLNGKTITFDEKVKGWTSFHSWIPEEMVRINNRFYTFKNGQLYLHNDDSGGHNNFYGSQFSSKVKTVFNQEPQIDKIFKTIVTESDKAWAVTVTTNLTNSTITRLEFNNRESRWYSYIRQNENSSDLRGVSQGIGRILSINGNDVTFDNVSPSVSIGNKLIQVNGGNQEEIGTITNIVDGVITYNNNITAPVVGLFCFGKKDGRIEGASIRGYYMEVELEDDTTGANELFAVSTNAVKSYL